jgi:ActR/RegA family two-component response regulator
MKQHETDETVRETLVTDCSNLAAMVCAVQLGAKRSWTRIPANVANPLRTLQVLGLENASERQSLCDTMKYLLHCTCRLFGAQSQCDLHELCDLFEQ